MKKFMLLTAMALPLVFAACNNEEDFGFDGQNPQEEKVVAGARLAGKGMTITAGDADTRLNAANKWEKGDKLGVAWVTMKEDFNNAEDKLNLTHIIGFNTADTFTGTADDERKKQYAKVNSVTTTTSKEKITFLIEDANLYNGTTRTITYNKEGAKPYVELAKNTYCKIVWDAKSYTGSDGYQYFPKPMAGIAQEQYPVDWTAFAGLTDSKLYANHMFEFNGSNFGYYGDIYEGAYFAYWPFQRLGATKELAFKLDNKQTVASSEEFFLKKSLQISAIDTVEARNARGEFVTKEEGVNKAFNMVRVANGLSVNTKFIGDEEVEGLKISKVEVAAVNKSNKMFATEATFNPHKLPYAVYSGANYNATATGNKMNATNLFGSDKALYIANNKRTSSISTAVNMDLNAENTVGILTFPTADKNVAAEDVKIVVTVNDAKGNEAGYFEVAYKENASGDVKANNDQISKLAALLHGGYTLSGKTYSLQELQPTFFNINVNLMMADFTSTKTWNVTSVKEWNEAVAEINALGISEATINVANNLTFETVAPEFPTDAALTVNGKTMTLKGVEATINKNVATLDFVINKGAELNIAEGAKLTTKSIDVIDGKLNVNGAVGADGSAVIKLKSYEDLVGEMNLGAKGVIESGVTIQNANVINVTEGTANKIDATVEGTGAIKAVVTNGANAANIVNNVKATEITFNGATVNGVALKANVAYISTGNTTFKGNLGTAITSLTVKEGTLTFDKGATVTWSAAAVTVNKDAKMVIATGNTVTMKTVTNNGVVELQKGANGALTTWKTTQFGGNGSVEMNGNKHVVK